jgi:ankyrin repeat protein
MSKESNQPMKRVISALFALAASGLAAPSEQTAGRFYQAIRNNDLPALRALLTTGDANVRGKQEVTPLMDAAAFGSVEAVKMLLAAGAAVNAREAFGATALMFCAGQPEKARLLLNAGADVNARSKQGRTALLLAAFSPGASEIVKLLLDKGADPAAADGMGMTPLLAAIDANDKAGIGLLIGRKSDLNARNFHSMTPLMSAAAQGDLETTKALLKRGADVNYASPENFAISVKNGSIGIGKLTALHTAVSYAPVAVVRVLVDAGARLDARDVRGMTPLMLAVASDRSDVRVVRLLLEKGADPHARDIHGETVLDWARKYNRAAVLEALGMEPRAPEGSTSVIPTGGAVLPAAAEAVTQTVAMLQAVNSRFLERGGCVSCHAQNTTGMAVAAAQAHGIHVDEAEAAAQIKTARLFWSSMQQMLLQRLDGPGPLDTMTFNLAHFTAGKVPADRITDALLFDLAAMQNADGSWNVTGLARPPMSDGAFSRTAFAIRSLQVFGIPGRQAEYEERIRRAASWLRSNTPLTTEDQVMQALGLMWAGSGGASGRENARKILALQRADGGWGQTPALPSDAYATRQALYALSELGVPAADPAFRRGVAHLLRTREADGSWHIKSRAAKFQPYFQSGFPHDHDQWISEAGTAWAVIGLAPAVEEKPMAAALQ